MREILTSAVQDPVFQVGAVGDWARAAGVAVKPLFAGDRLEWPGITARVWWPARVLHEGSIPNNGSVVLTADVKGVHVVLLGDIEREAARAVGAAIRRDPQVPGWEVDVVKVAHHGSANIDPAVLDALPGAVAVISVGAVSYTHLDVYKRQEQILAGANGAGAGAGAPAASGGSAPALINLNSADLAQLDTLPGVGPVLAQRILDWRAQHGRFTSVDELGEVSGIGDTLLAQLTPKVSV